MNLPEHWARLHIVLMPTDCVIILMVSFSFYKVVEILNCIFGMNLMQYVCRSLMNLIKHPFWDVLREKWLKIETSHVGGCDGHKTTGCITVYLYTVCLFIVCLVFVFYNIYYIERCIKSELKTFLCF